MQNLYLLDNWSGREMMCKNVFMKSLYMYTHKPLSQYTKALIYNCVLQNW